MFIAIMLLVAIGLFLLDAFRSDIFPKVDKTALGLAFFAIAFMVMSGKLQELI